MSWVGSRYSQASRAGTPPSGAPDCSLISSVMGRYVGSVTLGRAPPCQIWSVIRKYWIASPSPFRTGTTTRAYPALRKLGVHEQEQLGGRPRLPGGGRLQQAGDLGHADEGTRARDRTPGAASWSGHTYSAGRTSCVNGRAA